MIEERKYDVLARFFREPEFEGWVAHVLSLDVVTHGDTLREAIDMATEAAGEVIVDDLNAGVDPSDRRAPDEEWEAAFRSVAAAGKSLPLTDVLDNESDFRNVVLGLSVTVGREVEDDRTGRTQRIEGHGQSVAAYLAERVA